MKKYHISDLDGIQQNETYMMQNGGFLGEQRMSIGDRTRWFALIVLCLGTLMIVLDTTIVNVALPSIRASLGFSGTSLAWVVNAYLLTFGGFLLLGGRLGALVGHELVHRAGRACEGDGRFRLRCRWRRKYRCTARRRPDERAQLALDLSRQPPDRRRGLRALPRPVASRPWFCTCREPRYRWRCHHHGVAHARCLRDRQWQPGGLDV